MGRKPVKVTWELNEEVPRIVDHIVQKFPTTFPNFDKDKVLFVTTKANKKYKKPLKLHCCRYPYFVATDPYVYIVELLPTIWDGLSQKQKNMAVFHIMCAIPDKAFDQDEGTFARKKAYDYELYEKEYQEIGVADWMMDASKGSDPLSIEKKKGGSKKSPVTKEAIEEL